MCLARQREYLADNVSVSAARNFTSAFLVAMLPPHGWRVADDAALVISELMSCAIETGAERVRVRLEVHAEYVDLIVAAAHPDGAAAVARGSAVASPLDGRCLDGRPGEARQLGAGARRRILDELTGGSHTASTAHGAGRQTARLRCAPQDTGDVPCRLRRV